MIVDDPADVERRVQFEGVDKIHKVKGRLGKGLASIPVEIEKIIGLRRVFDGLSGIRKWPRKAAKYPTRQAAQGEAPT